MIAFDSAAFSVTAFSPDAFAFGEADDSSLLPGYGGGSTHDDYALHRDHWEYIEGLREIHVQVADDVHGVRDITIPMDMQIPESLAEAMNIKPRAMRGKVLLPTVADVMNDPLILAALVMLIDED